MIFPYARRKSMVLSATLDIGPPMAVVDTIPCGPLPTTILRSENREYVLQPNTPDPVANCLRRSSGSFPRTSVTKKQNNVGVSPLGVHVGASTSSCSTLQLQGFPSASTSHGGASSAFPIAHVGRQSPKPSSFSKHVSYLPQHGEKTQLSTNAFAQGPSKTSSTAPPTTPLLWTPRANLAASTAAPHAAPSAALSWARRHPRPRRTANCRPALALQQRGLCP
mmetsp:Transcript_30595/g.92583  ORF Transcript_30595/g.92583 Transcript_30595/m.92583 type:complete len:222 (+) Transcript_30595:739-1404(+)